MFSRTLVTFSIGGVTVRIDASWALISLLVAWSFTERFTTGAGNRSVPAAIAMGVGAAVVFFVSVLAHELAHAFEARHRGVDVRDITLYMFGGATATTSEARRPVDEFALTVVGPYTSFVLAAALGLVTYGAEEAGVGAVAEVTGVMAWLNLALGIFNLLPGAPLDGGRILESAVWRVTGDRLRAKAVAAQAGRVLGAILIGVGLLEVFFVIGGFVGGLWLAFIGWFLLQAATAERAQAELQRLLSGRTARSLVAGEPDAVERHTSLSWMVDNLFRRLHVDTVAVEEDGRVVGIVSVDDVRAVPPEDRWLTTAGDVARPIEGLTTVDADTPAVEALRGLAEGPVAVVEGGRFLGLLTAARVVAVLERERALEGAGTRRGWGA